MGGKGRHRLLGLWSPDPVLSLVASVGLAAASGTSIVLDPEARHLSDRRLADLLDEGPSLDELSPGRRGVAYLPGGGGSEGEGVELARRMAARWPAVVLRLFGPSSLVPSVPVAPLFDGMLVPRPALTHAVWQPVGRATDPPGPGPVLPRLRPGLVRQLIDGRLPRRSRWIDALAPIWEMPWE